MGPSLTGAVSEVLKGAVELAEARSAVFYVARTGNKVGLRKLDISLLRQLGGQMRQDHQNSLPMAQA